MFQLDKKVNNYAVLKAFSLVFCIIILSRVKNIQLFLIDYLYNFLEQ